MGFLVLLCALAAISGTLGYYGYPEPQNPGSCDCGGNSPSPPGSYPAPNPGSSTPSPGSPPTSSPGSPPSSCSEPSPPSNPPPNCKFPADINQVLDKNPKYRNIDATYLIRGENTIYGTPCGLYRSSYGCFQVYYVRIIITVVFDIIFQTWTQQYPIRGLPPFPEQYQFTEQVLKSCGGNKLCGVGNCTHDGYYKHPGYCYTYPPPYGSFGSAVSYGCNSTYCITDLGDYMTMVNQDGVKWLGPSIHTAKKDINASVAYVRTVYNYTSADDIQRSLNNLEKYYTYLELCEVNHNSSTFYISSCGAYKTPYKENISASNQ